MEAADAGLAVEAVGRSLLADEPDVHAVCASHGVRPSTTRVQ